MAANPSFACEVTYHGFVYVKGPTGVVPGLAKVKEAYKLLKKPKAARQMHPLFARGFETKLSLKVRGACGATCGVACR